MDQVFLKKDFKVEKKKRLKPKETSSMKLYTILDSCHRN